MAQKKSATDTDTIPNAESIIKRFGGIRPMATKLEVPVTTVQGWKKRNAIPENRRQQILDAAKKHEVSLNGLKGFKSSSANENKPAGTTTASAKPKAASSSAKKPAKKTTKRTAAPKTGAQKTKAAPNKAAKVTETTKTEPQAAAPKTAATSAPTTPIQVQPKAATADQDKTITLQELQAVRQESLRNGAITAAVIAGVVTVSALFLFPSAPNNPALQRDQVVMLENRLQNVEHNQAQLSQQIPMMDKSLNSLQQRTANVLSLLGATEEGSITTESSLSGKSVLETVAFLEKRVQTMDSPQLQRMTQQFETLSQNSETQATLQSGFEELRKMVSGIQGRISSLDQEVETTQSQLAQTVGGAGRSDVQAAALLLALGQFRSAVNRSGPFAEDLNIMKGLIGTNNTELLNAIERLTPYAESGILSPESLSAELRQLAGDLIVARLSGEETSLKDKMLQRLNSMVSVSKDGQQQALDNSPQHIQIARAQSELARGNIHAAVREVQSIPDVDPKTIDPWVQQAQATMAAQGVEVMIMKMVLSQIQAFKQGGLDGLEKSVHKTMRHVIDDANRIMTNPALNLPAIPMPEIPTNTGPTTEIIIEP